MQLFLILLTLSPVLSNPNWFNNLDKLQKRLSQRWESRLEQQVDSALGQLRTTLDRLPSVLRPQRLKAPSQKREPLAEYIDPDAELVPPEELKPETDAGEFAPAPAPAPSFPDFQDTLGVSLFPGFEIFRRRDWWKGPNVCISEEEEEEVVNITTSFPFAAMLEFTHCQQLPQQYTCETKKGQNGIQRTFKVTYECCYGFRRSPGESGCSPVGELSNLMDTLVNIEAFEFANILRNLDAVHKLEQENLTLFVPSDDALLEYMQETEMQNNLIPELKRKKRQEDSLGSVIMSHMTQGFLLTTDMKDEQILPSETEDATIRINYYGHSPLGGRVLTSNCARVTDSDTLANNGVVHTVAQVMTPVTQTVAELLRSDPQFSILAKLLKTAGLISLLREKGSYTVFAPTDAAFKSDPLFLNKLIKGKGCLTNVLKHHLVGNVICSVAIQGKVFIHTQQQTKLELRRDEDERVTVNGVKLLRRDILGTNGVIHVIDGVLMPESARTLSQALRDANLTEFHSLLERSDMLDMFDNMDNFTVFVPTNEALTGLPDDVKQKFMSNPEHLKNVLMYHVTNPEVASCDVDNNMVVSTGMANRNLRINTYRQHHLFNRMSQRVTAQCARLRLLDHRTCAGRVHLLDRLLTPPTGTVMDYLANNNDFTKMTALLQDSGFAERLIDEGPWTVLAVPDDVFDLLPEDQLAELLNNKEKAKEIAGLHVIPEMICCHGVGRDLLFGNIRYRTVGGGRVSLRRSDSGRIRAGPATVTQCDHAATNGVVHVVNSLIMPNKLRQRNPFHRIRLPGLFEIQFHTV